jgi:hypothetical protein
MPRPREFDTNAALDNAIGVFREHRFEGSSAQMLVNVMGIGRQSLYTTFDGRAGNRIEPSTCVSKRQLPNTVMPGPAALIRDIQVLPGRER